MCFFSHHLFGFGKTIIIDLICFSALTHSLPHPHNPVVLKDLKQKMIFYFARSSNFPIQNEMWKKPTKKHNPLEKKKKKSIPNKTQAFPSTIATKGRELPIYLFLAYEQRQFLLYSALSFSY